MNLLKKYKDPDKPTRYAAYFLTFSFLAVSITLIYYATRESEPVNLAELDAYDEQLDKDIASLEAEESNSNTTDPTIIIGQENALDKANSYLNFTAFSREGLREQLEYEGFTPEEIDYALEYVPVDYNEQASRKALSYYTRQNLSKQGVYDQLIYEKFTPEQAQHGVNSLPE